MSEKNEYFEIADALWSIRNRYLAKMRSAPENSFYRAWFSATCNLLQILHRTGAELNREQAEYFRQRMARLPRP